MATLAEQSLQAVKLNVSVELITPGFAAEAIMNHLINNRPLRESRVDLYSESLLGDRWELNGETIVFTKSGWLVQGQHRLTACVRTGVSFWSVVVRGISDDIVVTRTFDEVAPRVLADVMHQEGVKSHTKDLAKMVQLLYMWDNHGAPQAGQITMFRKRPISHSPSNAVMKEWADKNIDPDLLLAALRVGKSNKRLPLKGSVVIFGAVYYALAKIDEDRAEAFYEDLYSGANMQSNDPVMRARDLILTGERTNYGRITALPPTVLAGTLVNTWNARCRSATPSKPRLLFRGLPDQFPDVES